MTCIHSSDFHFPPHTRGPCPVMKPSAVPHLWCTSKESLSSPVSVSFHNMVSNAAPVRGALPCPGWRRGHSGTSGCAVEEPSPVPGSTPCSRPAAALRALAQRSAGVTHRSHQQPSPSAHLRLQDSAVHQRRESGLECVQRGLSCVPVAVHPSPCCVCCRMGLHTSVQSAGCVEMAGKVLPTPASIRGTEQLLE